MNILSAFVVALGLSMDNFAAAIAAGCGGHRSLSRARILAVSCSFAAAHFIMFGTGWLGGHELGLFIDSVDHWIAFGVLVLIGGKMIKEALFPDKNETSSLTSVLTVRAIFSLAVATSLDALLVGVGLSLVAVPFWLTAVCMVVCVFLTSYAGFRLGAFLGYRFGRVMEVLGGVVLAGIGIKILLEGLRIW